MDGRSSSLSEVRRAVTANGLTHTIRLGRTFFSPLFCTAHRMLKVPSSFSSVTKQIPASPSGTPIRRSPAISKLSPTLTTDSGDVVLPPSELTTARPSDDIPHHTDCYTLELMQDRPIKYQFLGDEDARKIL